MSKPKKTHFWGSFRTFWDLLRHRNIFSKYGLPHFFILLLPSFMLAIRKKLISQFWDPAL